MSSWNRHVTVMVVQALRNTGSTLFRRQGQLSGWQGIGCLAIAGMLSLALTARAAPPGAPSLSEADYPVYAKLALAQEVMKQKESQGTGDRQTLKDDFAKACTEAGWTDKQYWAMKGTVEQILTALRWQEDSDPDMRANAAVDLKSANPTTVATVKAHRKDLDEAAIEKRAKQQIKNEQLTGDNGRPATADEIKGKWAVDYDYMEQQSDPIMKQVAAQTRKDLPSSTYAFGPGDKVVVTNQRRGKPLETWEGTYRYQDGQVTVSGAGAGRNTVFDMRIKDGHLAMGLEVFAGNRMYTFYRKE